MCETLLTQDASNRSPLGNLVAPDSKLATVLNEARQVCAVRNASKEWQSFEHYMYACLCGMEESSPHALEEAS